MTLQYKTIFITMYGNDIALFNQDESLQVTGSNLI